MDLCDFFGVEKIQAKTAKKTKRKACLALI